MGHSMIDPNDWTHDRPCDQNDKRAVLWCFICVSGSPSPPSLPKAPSPLLHLYFPHQPGGQQTASTEKYIRQSFTKIWTMRPVKGKDRDSICASLTWNKYTPENSARIKSGVGSERNACHFLRLTARNKFVCDNKCRILLLCSVSRQNCVFLHNCNSNCPCLAHKALARLGTSFLRSSTLSWSGNMSLNSKELILEYLPWKLGKCDQENV